MTHRDRPSGVEASGERSFGLDVLRAMAIATVLYAHSSVILVFNNLHNTSTFAYMYGYLPDGVSLFFALSGFLIGRGVIADLEAGKAAGPFLGSFFFRRLTRTLPQYFIVLVGLSLLATAYGNPVPDLAYWFFLQNLDWPMRPIFAESWSLAVEEWFYLLLPLLTLLLRRIAGPRAAILGACGLLILGTFIHRYQVLASMPEMTVQIWDTSIRQRVLTRLDALAYGVLAAYGYCYHRALWNRWRHVALAIGLALLVYQIIFFVRFREIYAVKSVVLDTVSFVLLLPFFADLDIRNRLVRRPVEIIARTSYTIYLVHLSVALFHGTTALGIPLIAQDVPFEAKVHRAVLQLFIYAGLTAGLTWLLYTFVDRPIMAWRKRVIARSRRAPNGVEAPLPT